jgi:hypothetical protein
MSKVETLRSAVEYIRDLQTMLVQQQQQQHGGEVSVKQELGYSSVCGQQDSSFSASPPSLTHLRENYSPPCSVASSPNYSSDSSSYDNMVPDDEDDLLDFTAWFS